jgi:cell division GTPase FtsZ
MARMESLFTTECDSGIYSKSKAHIQYVPRVTEPISPDMLYDLKKYKELRKEINSADISDEDKMFLNFAATRHIVFDYESVADYYTQASKTVQELMEKSGLVILDFNDAMENGYVEMTETLRDLREEDDASK